MTRIKKRTSEIINTIIHNAQTEDDITIGQFIHTLGERVFGLAILLFALPNSLPILGIPGFSSITGIPIIVFGLQMALGKKVVWLPATVHNYRFSQKKLAVVLEKSSPVLRRMELVIRPRLLFMLNPVAERFIGFAFFALGIILALPIPFGNFLPGISLTILALGLLERDGVVVLLGMISGIISSSIISAALVVFVKSFVLSLQYFM